jgi:ParB-like chromosome segregation protein Spo0J
MPQKEIIMNVQEIEIKQIKPYENNAKKHTPTQISNVAESIKQFGFVQPLVLTEDRHAKL